MESTTSVDRDLVVDLTRDLVRMRSINPPGDERPVAEYLARRMRDLGIEAELNAEDGNRANVIGRVRGRGEGHLVLTGHLDVVPPGGQTWEHDPFGADLVDGRIYGRGSADMKGGVAAIVTALASLARSGFQPSADVIGAFTFGEEAGMYGAQAMVATKVLTGARYLIVAEPSDLGVFIGEKGVLWTRVRAFGRTAHGSMPHLGINAVNYIARLVHRLERYPFPFDRSELLGEPSLSVNVISGGNKTNVVPDVCEIEIDMRTVPGQDHSAMVTQLRSIAEDIARDFHPGLRVEIEVDQDVEALETDPEHELVTALVASVECVQGRTPDVGGVPYGTDGAHLGPGYAMPVVICGPGAAGMAHQPDEWVAVEQLVQGAEIYADLARRLLS
jgi:succinyl-diaminopimelate desuccinylase